ncbi:MAG: 4Fe-4S binding protein, partial [Rikenellaceae bacterium]
MNFLTINNDLCNSCNICLKNCPKNAIFIDKGQYKIDFTKCVACGTCFKACAGNAIKLEIPVEKINQAFIDSSLVEEQKASINQLTSENKLLAEQIKVLNLKFKILVTKLNEAIIVIDQNGKVVCTNQHFISLLDKKTKEMLISVQPIEGMDIRNFLSSELYRQLLSVQNKGGESLWIETRIGDSRVSASIYPIKRGDYVFMIFRNMEFGHV